MRKILFIGGPGTISTQTMDRLLEKGFALSVINRSGFVPERMKRHVTVYRGNRDDAAFLKKTIKEAGPECIIDVCCFLPDQAAHAIEAAKEVVDQYIFISTVDVYGYPLTQLPMKVGAPKTEPVSEYALQKLRCEELFLSALENDAFPVTIFRPSYSFGPKFLLSFFSRSGGAGIINRIRAKRPIVVPGDGNTLMHASSAFNTGNMIGELVDLSYAIGKKYNGAHEHVVTHDEYYRLLGKAAGEEPELVHVPMELLLKHESALLPDNLLSELIRFNLFFSVEEFKHTVPLFQWEWSLEKAAKNYVAVHDKKMDFPNVTTTFEDRIIEVWNRAEQFFTDQF